MILLRKSILTHPSIATFYYAINVCGIKLLIFGQHFSVPPTNVFFMLLLLLFNPRPYLHSDFSHPHQSSLITRRAANHMAE